MPGSAWDPIIAVATAPGRGAVGIVRISGQGLAPLARALFGRDLRARYASYLPFPDSQGAPLDRGLALYFPAPHSFTGEDVLELQAHGGPVLLQLLVRRCMELAEAPGVGKGGCLLPGLRLARPGEFSERAFLNGKLDLAQAEAVADLIDASTETAARSAARSLSGAFSAQVHGLLQALTHLRMLVEATLDFPEEDIDFLHQADARGQLRTLRDQVAALQETARQGALLREGIKVVIAGQPNVGKSSLLNALAGAELAIVTPVAGTTRDKIQQTVQIEGVALHIIDTAGLRETQDVVEQIGVQRAWGEVAQADAVLFVHDLARAVQPDYRVAEQKLAAQLQSSVDKHVPILHLGNKLDLLATDEREKAERALTLPEGGAFIRLSSKTGAGLPELRKALLQAAGWKGNTEGLFIARDRHLQALARVGAHLQQAQLQINQGASALELLAEELRLAQNALGEITGAFGADDLLGVIFSSFCIGK